VERVPIETSTIRNALEGKFRFKTNVGRSVTKVRYRIPRKMQIPDHDMLFFPVEERRIDHILGEEFSVNPDFLRFFLEQARLTAIDEGRIVGCADDSDCIAVCSATTGAQSHKQQTL
jgi:hypothetical protein